MRVPQSGLRIDSPAWPLLQAGISYWGVTDAVGLVTGLSLIDSLCSTAGLQPNFRGLGVKLLSGDAAGQVRAIPLHNLATGEITVGSAFTDYNGAIYQVPAGTRFCIGAVGVVGGGGPVAPATILSSPFIVETWQDVLGIDFTIWNVTVTGTGTVVRTVIATHIYALLAAAANGDTARLASVQQWQFNPNLWGVTSVNKRMTMEWEGWIGTVADIDNALFFMGMGSIALTTRATPDIAGFILVGDVLQAITDDGGAETITPLAAVTFDAWHKFKVVAFANTVRFWVDEVVVATHVANLPDAEMFAQYFCPNEAGANGGTLRVSINGLDPDPYLV